jgi:bacillolysin
VTACVGVDADDVLSHEWAHAYNTYTSKLLGKGDAGAVNEGLSDIWGEVIDQLNGRGCDKQALRTHEPGVGPCGHNSSRWIIGEDDKEAFGDYVRDMWSPGCKRGADKRSSPLYRCSGQPNAEHSNSGIVALAFALLVDGGEFNGKKVQGVGLLFLLPLHPPRFQPPPTLHTLLRLGLRRHLRSSGERRPNFFHPRATFEL